MAAPAMITRPIPSSGEAMPVVGLGTSQVFDVGEGAAARQPLAEVLRLLLDSGGKIIDTSPMYGRAEAVTGDLVAEAGARARVFLATKVWTSGREAGIAQMRRSAELLKSPVLDLIQVHNLLDWRTHLATLRQMKEKGQVRYIGITHYTTGSPPELARILQDQIYHRRTGGNLRDPGDEQSGAHGGRPQGRHRPPARCEAAPADPAVVGFALIRTGGFWPACGRDASGPDGASMVGRAGNPWRHGRS